MPSTRENELGASDAAQPTHSMPGLDCLRGAAIIAVFLYHCVGAGPPELSAAHDWWIPALVALLRKGYLGVHLFFVLSGFLITGILLASKADHAYYKKFYARRIVRIVPAYFLMIFVLWACNMITVSYVFVCLLFLCNMSALLHTTPQYGPFWSLSVEEQFYAVWPLVVAKLPRQSLVALCWAIVLLTPVLRLCLLKYAPHQFSDIRYKTWDLIDFFAAGGLLALYVRSAPSNLAVWRLSIGLTLAGGGVTIAGWNMDISQNSFLLAFALEPTLILCAGLLLIAFRSSSSTRTLPGRILAFFGATSYGLYLVHQFVIDMVLIHVNLVPDPVLNHVLRMMVAGLVAVAVAFVSRYTFEAFFLRIRWRGKETSDKLYPAKA